MPWVWQTMLNSRCVGLALGLAVMPDSRCVGLALDLTAMSDPRYLGLAVMSDPT
jgi:hypothetical protein